MIAGMNDSDENKNAQIAALEKLVRAGDYKQARATVKRLLDTTDLSDAERGKIEALSSSMRSDNAAIGAFVFTFFVLLYLFLKYGI